MIGQYKLKGYVIHHPRPRYKMATEVHKQYYRYRRSKCLYLAQKKQSKMQEK